MCLQSAAEAEAAAADEVQTRLAMEETVDMAQRTLRAGCWHQV
jgi:hypothetical protein